MIHVQDTSDATFGEDVLEVEGVTLVDFWAPWTPTCRLQDPVLERFARAHPKVRVLRCNTDDNPLVPGQLGIRSLPSLVVFQDGMALVGSTGLLDERGIDRLLDEAAERAASIPQA